MTRQELHALVDIVMDAREKGIFIKGLEIRHHYVRFNKINDTIDSWNYPTFSDFTKAVQEYIKTLEG